MLELVSIRNYFYFFTIYTLINAFLTQNKGLYFVRIHVYEVADYNTIPVIVSAPSKSYESADGGAAVGGMAAHGLVKGVSGVSPTGMSEANLPRPHLCRARYSPRKNAKQ